MIPITRRAALLLLLAAGCSRPADDQRLVLTGSSTVAPLALEIGRRFEAENPGVRVDVQMGGSSRGLADARKGLAQIGMVSRALTPAERDVAGHVIALDGVCMIVHRDNPITALSDRQIVALYTGEVRDWSGVGGAQAPVTVVNKAAGRSTLEVFLAHFALAASAVRADVVIGDNEHGIRTVAGNRNAVGYVSIGAAEQAVRAGVPVHALALGGVAPTSRAVQAGDFPMARPLLLVTRPQPGALAARFIDFARSARVRDLVERQSFVPITD